MILHQLEAPTQVHSTLYLNNESYVRRRPSKTAMRTQYAPYTPRATKVAASRNQDVSYSSQSVFSGDMHMRHQGNDPRPLPSQAFATQANTHTLQSARMRPVSQPSPIVLEAEKSPVVAKPRNISMPTPPQLLPSEERTRRVASGTVADSRIPFAAETSAGTTYIGTEAQYSWPRHQKGPPRIYVDYRVGLSRRHQHLQTDALPTHPHSLANTASSPLVSSDDSTTQGSRQSSTHPFDSGDSPQWTAQGSSRPSTAQSYDQQLPSHTTSGSDLIPSGTFAVRHPPESTSTLPPISWPNQVGPSSSVRAIVPPEASETAVDKWLQYARLDTQMQKYTCLWSIVDSTRQETMCAYHSKKHLVKRHIESVHLQIKLLRCHVCDKAFSQQTNLNTHLNTHTGDAPHKCLYEGCESKFGDPARRHRHMKKVHKHVPTRRRTQGDLDDGSTPEAMIPPPRDTPDPASPDCPNQEL